MNLVIVDWELKISYWMWEYVIVILKLLKKELKELFFILVVL